MDFFTVFSWKLGRSKQLLPAQATETINNIINTIPVLDNRYYTTKDQTADGCFFIPTPEPGKEVVFPGSCNDDIAVVNNFDISQVSSVVEVVVDVFTDCLVKRK